MLGKFQWFLGSLRKFARAVLEKLNLMPGPKRYKHLFRTVDRCKARHIMEIGTWNGNHAVAMIKVAKKYWLPGEIEYYGFDLFEDADEKTIEVEISKKPSLYNEVKEKLEKTGAKINLYKGNTLNTLPETVKDLPKMDFIFIDGGHSIETVQNDWNYSKQLIHDKTMVIFDDYWNMEDSGCNKIVDSIDRREFLVEILQPTDKFKKKWGTLYINFVKVIKRTKNGEGL